jgi:hypothetical protein
MSLLILMSSNNSYFCNKSVLKHIQFTYFLSLSFFFNVKRRGVVFSLNIMSRNYFKSKYLFKFHRLYLTPIYKVKLFFKFQSK